jgi:hypothetical protein
MRNISFQPLERRLHLAALTGVCCHGRRKIEGGPATTNRNRPKHIGHISRGQLKNLYCTNREQSIRHGNPPPYNHHALSAASLRHPCSENHCLKGMALFQETLHGVFQWASITRAQTPMAGLPCFRQNHFLRVESTDFGTFATTCTCGSTTSATS